MPLKRTLCLLVCVSAFCMLVPPSSEANPASGQAGAANDCQPLEARIDAFAQTAMAAGVPGMVVGVARAGVPPVVRAYGLADVEHGTAMTPDSVFRLASLTKAFTAAAILRLAADGRLALETPAAALLPDRAWLGDITVEQLLNHTAGLADYAEDPAGASTRAAARTPSDMADWIERLEPRSRFEPGAAWAYSNSHYAILGLIIERVTGQRYADFLREAVLDPAGLTATSVDDPAEIVSGRVRGYTRSGQPRALKNAEWIHPTIPGPAGSLRATAPDVLAWNQALFSGRVIPADQVERMIAPGLLSDGRTTRWGMPEAWREGLRSDYAMGVFVADSPLGRRVWHTGDIDGFANWMAHWPDVGTTAVVLTNADFRSIDADAMEALVVEHAECEAARRRG